MLENTIKFLTQEQVKAVLENNSKWIETKGESGERASLDGYVLEGISLNRAVLQGASLDRAVFNGSDCSFANFKGAKLRGASFIKSKLVCANFYSTKLNTVSFERASLGGASLESTKINWGDFRKTVLHKARLNNAKIKNCNFAGANLVAATLNRSEVVRCSFFNTNLAQADMTYSNYSESNFSKANLSGADITGSILSQVTTEGWSISDIKCKYIYFDDERKKRVPRDRDFREGEFEELYSWFPNFTYYFKDSMHALDPYLLSVIVSGLNNNIDDLHLQIDEIVGRGFYPQVEFSFRGKNNLSNVEELVSNILDNRLDEMRGLVSNLRTSIEYDIESKINKVIGEFPMTKIEFNAPVQNVVTDNHGVVNINAISTTQVNEIIKAVKNLDADEGILAKTKKKAVKELADLASGELKSLTSESVEWLKTRYADLPAEVVENIQRWLGL